MVIELNHIISGISNSKSLLEDTTYKRYEDIKRYYRN